AGRRRQPRYAGMVATDIRHPSVSASRIRSTVGARRGLRYRGMGSEPSPSPRKGATKMTLMGPPCALWAVFALAVMGFFDWIVIVIAMLVLAVVLTIRS